MLLLVAAPVGQTLISHVGRDQLRMTRWSVVRCVSAAAAGADRAGSTPPRRKLDSMTCTGGGCTGGSSMPVLILPSCSRNGSRDGAACASALHTHAAARARRMAGGARCALGYEEWARKELW